MDSGPTPLRGGIGGAVHPSPWAPRRHRSTLRLCAVLFAMLASIACPAWAITPGTGLLVCGVAARHAGYLLANSHRLGAVLRLVRTRGVLGTDPVRLLSGVSYDEEAMPLVSRVLRDLVEDCMDCLF